MSDLTTYQPSTVAPRPVTETQDFVMGLSALLAQIPSPNINASDSPMQIRQKARAFKEAAELLSTNAVVDIVKKAADVHIDVYANNNRVD